MVILGEKEVQQGVVQLKDMTRHTQEVSDERNGFKYHRRLPFFFFLLTFSRRPLLAVYTCV